MLRLSIRIDGADEVLAAARRLPKDANNELRNRTLEVSRELAEKIRAAGEADTRQSARAAKSVKAVRDRTPVIRAGGTAKSRPVLFGSEFGMTRKSGWYAARRYFDSAGRQYRPHLGRGSYWFFRTAEREQPWIESQWLLIADEVIRNWRAVAGG